MAATPGNCVTKSMWLYQGAKGLSLLEMLISLAVFSVIVFPMVLIPMKTMDQTELAKNNRIAIFETGNFFDTFHSEVNRSYRFFDFTPIAADAGLNMPTNQVVFMAYWDNRRQTEVRVGYALKEIFGFSGEPRRFQIMRAEIPEDAAIDDYQITSDAWKTVGKIVDTESFYITATPGSTSETNYVAPQFVYCRAAVCSTSILPIDADGIRIQSDSTVNPPLGINLIYRNSTNTMRALYYRLATLQDSVNRGYANKQVLPFTTALTRWTKDDTWYAERTMPDTGFGAYNIPVHLASQVAGGTALPVNDMHYNYRTGELLTVTNSAATTSAQPESALYIFKSKPGLPNYKPYALSVASGGSYANTFPIVIHQGDAAWPPVTTQVDCLSVTQDLDNNIFVLMRTGAGPYEYWIEKFTVQGQFVSRFHLGSDMDSASATAVVGITYNPSSPDEIIALIRKTSTPTYVFRSYLKDQNNDSPARVITTAESTDPINGTAITPAGFNWTNAKGIEYDPINHRMIVVFGAASADVQVLALDINMNQSPGPNEDGFPVDRAAIVTKVYMPDELTTLQDPRGIAYDPLNNLLFLPVNDAGGAYNYYTVIPNRLLNLVHTSAPPN
jgi:prepilin-type N-terminal cleavage/methylation domain-containing protein